MLRIISVTKDDLDGISATILSTKSLRKDYRVSQTIIDSSCCTTSKLVKQIADSEGIDYIWQEPKGISQAFNQGIKQAATDWIWFLNGGDTVHPDVDPTLILKILEKSTAKALVFEIEFKELHSIYKHPPLWRIWPCLFEWIPHPGTILKQELFDLYGLYDSNFKIAMDGESWLRLFSNEVIVDMISIPIALYDQTGISSTNEALMGAEVKAVIKKYLRLMIKTWFISGKSIYSAWRRFNRLSNKE